MEFLKTLALVVDCFAALYTDKSDVKEIATKAGISVLDLDLDGSPRDRWINVVQFLSYNNQELLSLLVECAREDNETSECLLKSARLLGLEPATGPSLVDKDRSAIVLSLIHISEPTRPY